jgi:hypothetical protein
MAAVQGDAGILGPVSSSFALCKLRCPETGSSPYIQDPAGLPCRPRSADRARSLALVSKKREYFKCRPETIGYFAPKLFKLGV